MSLHQYPEVREVCRTHRPLIIPNVRTSDIMESVQPMLARTPYESMMVFPIFARGRFFGVMSVRMEQKNPIELYYVEKFGQVCAQILSLAIGTPGQPDVEK